MSFIERNKAWVLPLLGVAALGVVWMNIQMHSPKKPPPDVAPGPVAPPPAPTMAAPLAAPLPSSAPPGAPGSDLWADLRPLEEPWSGLNQRDALLAKGAMPFPEALLHPEPYHPESGAPSVHPREAPTPRPAPTAAPSLPGGHDPAKPLPDVDFLIRTPKGTSAWVQGHGAQEGQSWPGGWKIRRVTTDMVEVEGPGGVIQRWTNPVKAPRASLSSPKEPQ